MQIQISTLFFLMIHAAILVAAWKCHVGWLGAVLAGKFLGALVALNHDASLHRGMIFGAFGLISCWVLANLCGI